MSDLIKLIRQRRLQMVDEYYNGPREGAKKETTRMNDSPSPTGTQSLGSSPKHPESKGKDPGLDSLTSLHVGCENRYAWWTSFQLCDIGAQLKIDLPITSDLEPLERAVRADIDSLAGVAQHVAEFGCLPTEGSPNGHIQHYHPDQLRFLASRVLADLDIDDLDFLDVRTARVLATLLAGWCLWIAEQGCPALAVPEPQHIPDPPTI